MTTASGWMERWRTARALGMGNVARVVAYRGMKRVKLAKWLTAPPAQAAVGDLFRTERSQDDASLDPDLAIYFSRHQTTLGDHVPWLYDPFAEESFEDPERHWSEIPINHVELTPSPDLYSSVMGVGMGRVPDRGLAPRG